MPKIPVVKPGQVMAALEKAGFHRVRQRGSHVQFKRGNLLVTVPNHTRDLNTQVVRSIMRQAQLTLEEFTSLLK
jgi:predicted RNA binding protein YcfA (HicA-like mRNA interferase family)